MNSLAFGPANISSVDCGTMLGFVATAMFLPPVSFSRYPIQLVLKVYYPPKLPTALLAILG
jgi:hypothetical protein